MTTTLSPFALPDSRAAKADAALIARDEAQFAAIAASLARQIADASDRLEAQRRAPAGQGQKALDRDLEIHRLTARLRLLRRFGLDLCLGRMVPAEGGDPVYIGRIGLSDADGEPLLVDWRARAAEPFFGATHADPMGLSSRRRYRWSGGRIVDYWDEVFTADALESGAALDDQSAFIASLGASRSPHMRDVLATIQADQDAIIRAPSAGALVVDGGPGTGKTVVALHRAAYLLHAEPRMARGGGGVLVVGPSRAYLDHVSDVLPSLGEEGVRVCTVDDLVVEGAIARAEPDPRVASLKADGRMVQAIEPAVRLYEEPPVDEVLVETPWTAVVVTADDWADAFASPEPGTPHNEARDQVWETLLELIADRHDDEEVPADLLRRALAQDRDLATAFTRAWPRLEAADLVSDLWTVPAYLRRCAPWLADDEVRLLTRADGAAWTSADLPLLDAARMRLGDPGTARRAREREAALSAQRAYREDIADYLIANDDSEMGVAMILRGDDARESLVDEADVPAPEPDALIGPFAHIVVDEAQELTDAQWQMLLRRCPSRSLTVVGDRAQARHGFLGSWEERLARAGLRDVRVASLAVNYRTPSEIMAVAEPVIRAALPDANVPVSVRSSGIPVRRARAGERDAILERWLDEHGEGTACVIGDPGFRPHGRVRSATPEDAKGLEFDLVLLADADAPGGGIEAAVDRYVAMTRATRELILLDAGPGETDVRRPR
ncbi:RNA polymerase recycling motor ATPase HelR [Microbacterium sp. KNMS]